MSRDLSTLKDKLTQCDADYYHYLCTLVEGLDNDPLDLYQDKLTSLFKDLINAKTIDDFMHIVDTFDRWLIETPDFSIAIDLQKAFLSLLNEFKPRYRSSIVINQQLTNYGRNFIMWIINKLTCEDFRNIDNTWRYQLDQVDGLIARRYNRITKDLEMNKLQIRLDEDGHRFLIFNKVTIYDQTFVTHYLLEHMDIDYVICNYSDQPIDKRTGSARSISFDLTQLKRYIGGHEHACRVSTSDIEV